MLLARRLVQASRSYGTAVPRERCRPAESFFLGREQSSTRVVISAGRAESDTPEILVSNEKRILESDVSDRANALLPRSLRETVAKNLDMRKAGAAQLLYLPTSSQPHVLVSAGKGEKMEMSAVRSITFQALSQLQGTNAETATWELDSTLLGSVKGSTENVVDAIARTAVLTSYRFDRHCTHAVEEGERPPKTPTLLQQLNIVLPEDFSGVDALKERVNVAVKSAQSTLLARDLVNERADVVTPEFVDNLAQDIVKLHESTGKVSMTAIRGVEELQKEGLRMLAAVGQCARWQPRLVVLEYKGAEQGEETTAFVGKGITFDSGGLNLKPTSFIEDMHMDMGGSAAVLSAFHTAVSLGLKKNLVAVLALAENAIGAEAYKPHAILEAHDGQTVEVGNTDAEGRLALADALSYVQEKYSPSRVIDLATLTGACVVALGEYTAGVFSNDPILAKRLEHAGEECFERCWPMPILPEHSAELSSDFADISSTGKGRFGGASTAAAFLEKFIRKDVRWAHVDIAGPAMYSAPREFMPKGGTGYGAQLLLEILQD